MKRMMTLTTIAAALAMPALAQTAWDVDGDTILTPEEFVTGFSAEGTYATFDLDQSGQLDAAEWDSGLGTVGEYANMDLNGDGGVDEAEYNALLFNRYDVDGSGAIEAAETAAIEADMAEDGMLAR
ncbi:hypothetical protein MWU52_05545 [Jannaschia sp. S6380]|uniref:hypothetical protein n=1 Tax=Jannaschia sp. S6380 TaxID=2926408 RepID=UPI001FF63040|nr:hypothetical protein [Jannaschia sp. S6380]MCK0167010.1 hypothetical protein [Jannaschia sp. S6380]